MFARVSRFGPVKQADEGLALIREAFVPRFEKQSGFEGLMVMIDRESDVAFVISFWKSGEDLAASREFSEREAEMVARTFNVSAEHANCEVAFSTLTFAA